MNGMYIGFSIIALLLAPDVNWLQFAQVKEVSRRTFELAILTRLFADLEGHCVSPVRRSSKDVILRGFSPYPSHTINLLLCWIGIPFD